MFFPRITLAILDCLYFHMCYRISLLIPEKKKKADILTGIVLDLFIDLGRIVM